MKRIVILLNVALMTMFGYLAGYHQGYNEEKPVDMQMQIRYAVAQALIEGQ